MFTSGNGDAPNPPNLITMTSIESRAVSFNTGSVLEVNNVVWRIK